MSPAELKTVKPLNAVTPSDKLEHGITYYAKILLTGLEAMFGKPADIAAKLNQAGFVGVLVSTQPIDDVPDRAPFASGSTYWARGVWGGQQKQLGGGAIPSQVKALWRSDDPPLDVSKVAPSTPVPGAAGGPSAKTLLLLFGGLYLLRKGRGRRLLGRLKL